MVSNDLTQLSSVENIEDRAEHRLLWHAEQYALHRRQTTTVTLTCCVRPVTNESTQSKTVSLSRAATSRSVTFDIKDSFDTSRRSVISVDLGPIFFKRGVTIACFCDTGRWSCVSDLLTSIVRYGNSRSTNSRTTGSTVHDLTGDCIKMHRTSDCVHDLNDASVDDA